MRWFVLLAISLALAACGKPGPDASPPAPAPEESCTRWQIQVDNNGGSRLIVEYSGSSPGISHPLGTVLEYSIGTFYVSFEEKPQISVYFATTGAASGATRDLDWRFLEGIMSNRVTVTCVEQP